MTHKIHLFSKIIILLVMGAFLYVVTGVARIFVQKDADDFTIQDVQEALITEANADASGAGCGWASCGGSSCGGCGSN